MKRSLAPFLVPALALVSACAGGDAGTSTEEIRGGNRIAPHYTIVDIGTLGGTSTGATGINNDGVVVGFSRLPTNVTHAITWQNGVMTDLGTHCASCLSEGSDINDDGVVSGGAVMAPGGAERPVRWVNGAIQQLGLLPGGTSGLGVRINAAGVIVGEATMAVTTPTGTQVLGSPFKWSEETGIQPLPTLGGFGGRATSISDSGEIVGYTRNAAGVMRATFWDRDGNPHDLGVLSGDIGSRAFRMNNRGDAIGFSAKNIDGGAGASTTDRATLWAKDGETTNLAALMPTYTVTRAFSINEPGDVVGSGAIGGVRHTILWSRGQAADIQLRLQPGHGWTVTLALNLNNDGVITGQGTHNGLSRSFVMIPNRD
jgi:probable HAF family extracellular repeat protein